MAAETAPESAPTDTAPVTPTDPYVVYQLRKPSQRGTAVIPRFVPNTHAPAFSPANYRFARVWATADPAAASPASLLNAPRSFEYAGSLGSESSFWSDTSSWVSVSSLRTAQSDVRAPLLHATTQPVSAASFFNSDFEHTRLRPSVRSSRSSDLESPARPDFRYPSALSESVSEDAVVDNLLSMRTPQFPAVSSDIDHQSSSSRQKLSAAAATTAAAPTSTSTAIATGTAAATAAAAANSTAAVQGSRPNASVPHITHSSHSSTRNHSAASASNPSASPHPHQQSFPSVSRSTAYPTTRGVTSKGPLGRHSLLPALTRKRRSLWQWLFCSDHAAASTTVPSVHAAPQRTAAHRTAPQRGAPHRVNPAPSTKPRAYAPQNASTAPHDRVPGGDKDFLQRAQRAPDATGSQQRRDSSNRRSPSFEILRGRPDHARTNARRSVSWSLMPRAFLSRDTKKKKKPPMFPPQKATAESTRPNQRKKTKGRQKDRARGIAPEVLDSAEDSASAKGHRIVFQKTLSRKETPSASSRRQGDGERRMPKAPETKTPVLRRERRQDRPRENRPREDRPREDRPREDRPREDRPREDRPRENRPREDRPRADRPRQPGQGPLKDSSSAAPVQASVVPSLREKTGGSSSSHSQRMRSGESSDQVASRISSDLSSTIERTTGSGSGRSTPILSRPRYQSESHELDPAAIGVSSDVSSHVSGGHGKASPPIQRTDPSSTPSAVSSSIDFDGIQARHVSRSSPFRSEQLFAFPSSSSESGMFVDPSSKNDWENPAGAYPEYGNTPVHGGSDATEESLALADPVARAREKNRARSVGGPLSYLMKQPDIEMDVNTQSTGLTSLADESVSTHKTISAIGDDYRIMPQAHGSNLNAYRDQKKMSRPLQEGPDIEMTGAATGRPIFQNSALFNYSGRISPSGVSSASPRRFHSDWSDPHATAIDVYCQCSCSCVYEEECRRSCELVYGRSPSVSSSRSGTRRGYPGFQTLPPAIEAAAVRHQRPSADVRDNSDEPLALRHLKSARGPGKESSGSTQKSYIRASALDELRDPRSMIDDNGLLASGFYNSELKDQRLSDSGSNQEQRFSQVSNGARYREMRKREENFDGHKLYDSKVEGVARSRRNGKAPLHVQGTGYEGQSVEGLRPSRRSELSPRHRTGSQNEGNGLVKEERSRSSSRRTPGTSASSRQSSALSRRLDTASSGVRDEASDGGISERRRGESGSRRRHGSKAHGEGTQQMGNSYVVKRNGMPPFGQTNIPQPYRASGYGRDVSYEYAEDGNGDDNRGTAKGGAGYYSYESGFENPELGPTPVVELEFETGGHDAYRHGATRNADGGHHRRVRNGNGRKYDVQHKPSRRTEQERHGQRKSDGGKNGSVQSKESRTSSKQLKPTSRTNSKGSSRSRTPLFGVF